MLDPYFAELRERGLAARLPGQMPSIEAIRAGMALESEALGAGPVVAHQEDHTLSTRTGKIRLRELCPEAPRGVMVFVHGGGWAAGRIEDFDSLGRALARATGCTVVLPDYRLAPEHPFPSGLDDVKDALLWAQGRADAAGLPLLGLGDSAGGNLILAAAAELGDRVHLAHITLAYPVANADFDTASYREHATGQLFTAATMKLFFETYAPEALWSEPRISVLGRKDLAGLPSALVLTCGHDLLRDEGILLAEALKTACVDVHHINYPTAPHGFLRHHAQSELANKALSDIGTLILPFFKSVILP